MEPLRVLVVGGKEELANVLVERLQLRGMDAHGKTAGWEALDHLLSTPYDVVLLDVKMPGLGGLEVIDLLNERRPEAGLTT